MDVNRARPVVRYGAGDSRGADSVDSAHSLDDGQYIRLRYSTQFTTGGRTHTIEMEVPVPVGASAELREQLIREAEAGMEQLYRRVEARARGQRPPEIAQRGASQAQPPAQQAPPSHQPQPSQPAQASRLASPDQRPPMPSAPAAASPVSSPTSAPIPAREGPQAISLQDRRAAPSAAQAALLKTTAPAQSQARPGVSPELPVVPGIASTGGGTMKLIEFLQIIRENWGLSAKQAMELLQVKSLNNMNYRDLLRQLEPLVEQASANAANPANSHAPASRPAPAPSAPPPPTGASGPARPAEHTSASPAPALSRPVPAPREQSASPRSAAPPASPAQTPRAPDLAGPPNIPVIPLRESTLRESGRVYKFDEEEDEQEELDEEAAAGPYAPEEDSSMSEAMARIKIDELREKGGTVGANSGRLVVLHNLLDSQISDEQFLQLIERLWNTVSDKKLKQDQVEALISWSKEDYFEDEVRAVLAVLREQA